MPYSSRLSGLRRPKLLIATARQAAVHYERDRDLPRLCGQSPKASARQILAVLFAKEAEIEALRKERDVSYCARTHIHLLAAIISEVGAPVSSAKAA